MEPMDSMRSVARDGERDTPFANDDPVANISVWKSIDPLVYEIRRPRQLLLHLERTIYGFGPFPLVWPAPRLLQPIVHSFD